MVAAASRKLFRVSISFLGGRHVSDFFRIPHGARTNKRVDGERTSRRGSRYFSFHIRKLVMRSLRGAIVARGFTSAQAERMLGHSGLSRLREMWDIYDKDHKKLTDHIPSEDWRIVSQAVTWRNKMAHGKQSYKLDECRDLATRVLAIANHFRQTITNHHGVDPWSRY
jgi:hypothetical protein